MNKDKPAEITVSRDQYAFLLTGEVQKSCISAPEQVYFGCSDYIITLRLQKTSCDGIDILVKQEFHAASAI